VYLTCENDDPCSVTVHYRSDQDVSGFAFDIQASGDAIITAVVPEFQGLSDETDQGYGIFLGWLKEGNIEPNGHVDNWGTPEAPGGHPDTAGSIPGNAVTVEPATLFDPTATGPSHKPAQTGILMTVYTDKPCELAFAANTTRAPASQGEVGGAVLTNGSSANLVQLGTCEVTAGECYIIGEPRYYSFPNTGSVPGPAITENNYIAWVNAGKPDAWCCPHHGYGDSNGDGYVTGNDYGLVTNHPAWDAVDCVCADMNHDGYINASDYAPVTNHPAEGDGTQCGACYQHECGS
jgi:hypothetical protein